MLNLKLGPATEIDGHPWIVVERGRPGFALYGPYRMLAAGAYLVEFRVELAQPVAATGDDPRCLVFDVAADQGRRKLVEQPVRLSQLADGRSHFAVSFDLPERTQLEFRAWVSGDAALRIADEPRLVTLTADDLTEEALRDSCFPDPADGGPPFFREHRDLLRRLFDEGMWVRLDEGRLTIRAGGVWIQCASLDDIAFVGEVFNEGAYNFCTAAPVCAIDIGMNVGLSSLLFASKPEVRQVHSFEPFRKTFDRALANIRLNPRLAGKITAHNAGLSNRDHHDTLLVTPVDASGSANVIEVPHGHPVQVTLRDAGAVLRPVIDAARAAGERVVVKVDCEGSEFAVFESLRRHGLLERIDAFMVEWHAMFEGLTQEALTAPLRAAGFLVIDRSPPRGNGFFYAVRLG